LGDNLFLGSGEPLVWQGLTANHFPGNSAAGRHFDGFAVRFAFFLFLIFPSF
jgi:hypothetical protein